MSKAGFKAVDVIVADDVRQEASGKLVIVGMYLGSIIGAGLPILLPTLAFLTKWCSEDGSLPSGTYKILDPDGAPVARIDSNALQAGPWKPFIISAHRLSPVRLERTGTYRWTFTPNGGRPRTLTEFVVATLGQPPALHGSGAPTT